MSEALYRCNVNRGDARLGEIVKLDPAVWAIEIEDGQFSPVGDGVIVLGGVPIDDPALGA